MPSDHTKSVLSRRAVLGGAMSGLTFGGMGTLPSPAIAQSASLRNRVGNDRVWMRRAGISEEISIRLLHDTMAQAKSALAELSWFMRDWKDEDHTVWIDPDLPHILAQVQTAASREYGSPRVIVVNSGVRTRRRNATIEGAARNSLHIRGKAADLSIRGVSPSRVKRLAMKTDAGGIGLYDTFTHLDTGRRRYW